MTRIANRFAAAAAALLGAASAAPALGYEAVVVGTGENQSIEYVGGRPAGQTGYASTVVGRFTIIFSSAVGAHSAATASQISSA